MEQTLTLERDCDIQIKTLIPYPLCALGDLNRYSRYIGRPCGAGKRSMSIDSQGKGHACWHMTKEYGSVVEKGLAQVWDDMEEWRDGKLIPDTCKKCPYLPLCGAGCRVAGAQYFGELKAEDNLRTGWENITTFYSGSIGVDDFKLPFEEIANLYQASYTPELHQQVLTETFKICDNIRIRTENGFYVVNLDAGMGFFLSQVKMSKLNPFLNGKSFTLKDFDNDELLVSYLMIKGVIKIKSD